jgi:hypothetical protein
MTNSEQVSLQEWIRKQQEDALRRLLGEQLRLKAEECVKAFYSEKPKQAS